MSRHTFLISADFVLMTSPWQMCNEWGLKQNKECLTQLAPLLKTETNILVCMMTWGWARFTCVKSKFSNEYFIMFARGNFRVKLPSNYIIFFFCFVSTPKWKTKKNFYLDYLKQICILKTSVTVFHHTDRPLAGK